MEKETTRTWQKYLIFWQNHLILTFSPKVCLRAVFLPALCRLCLFGIWNFTILLLLRSCFGSGTLIWVHGTFPPQKPFHKYPLLKVYQPKRPIWKFRFRFYTHPFSENSPSQQSHLTGLALSIVIQSPLVFLQQKYPKDFTVIAPSRSFRVRQGIQERGTVDVAEWCHFGKSLTKYPAGSTVKQQGDADRNVKFEHQQIWVVEDLTIDLILLCVLLASQDAPEVMLVWEWLTDRSYWLDWCDPGEQRYLQKT